VRASMLGVRYVALAFAIAVVLSGAARRSRSRFSLRELSSRCCWRSFRNLRHLAARSNGNRTVGNIINRIETGESFDLVIASPAALTALGKSGKLEGGIDLAKWASAWRYGKALPSPTSAAWMPSNRRCWRQGRCLCRSGRGWQQWHLRVGSDRPARHWCRG